MTDQRAGLGMLSEAYTDMQARLGAEAYRSLQAIGALADLRMWLHRFVTCEGAAKEDARQRLLAVAVAYDKKMREAMKRPG